jgi:hypothetical protein
MRTFRKKIYWWFFRRFIRISEIFIQSHAVISWNLADNLNEFKVRKAIEYIPTVHSTVKYRKIKHKEFNVLYYIPKGGDRKFIEWLYGYDIFLKVKKHYNHMNFIVVDGTYDMSKIYPITDFYIRCNRHDGPGRIRLECEVNNIPYYWSQKDPDYKQICKQLYDIAVNKIQGIL